MENVVDSDQAELLVHLEFNIFADDEQGRRIAEALALAVTRGVKCPLLIDAFGASIVQEIRSEDD